MLIFYGFGFTVFLNEKLKFLRSVKIWTDNYQLRIKN